MISNASLSFSLKSHDPVSKLKPIGIGNNTVYVQDGLKIVSDPLGCEVVSDQYAGMSCRSPATTCWTPPPSWTGPTRTPDRVIWATRQWHTRGLHLREAAADLRVAPTRHRRHLREAAAFAKVTTTCSWWYVARIAATRSATSSGSTAQEPR